MSNFYKILIPFVFFLNVSFGQTIDSVGLFNREVDVKVQQIQKIIEQNEKLNTNDKQYLFSFSSTNNINIPAYNSALSGTSDYNQIKADYPSYHNSSSAESKLHTYQGIDIGVLNAHLNTINTQLNTLNSKPIILLGLDAFMGRVELLRQFKTAPSSFDENDVEKKADYVKAFNHYAQIEEAVISKVGSLTGRRIIVIRYGGIQAVVPSVNAGDDISSKGTQSFWRNYVDSQEDAELRKLVFFNFNPISIDQDNLIAFIDRINKALNGRIEIVDCNSFAEATSGTKALRNIADYATLARKLQAFDKRCYQVLDPIDRIHALRVLADFVNSGPLDPVGSGEVKAQVVSLMTTIVKDADVRPMFEAFKDGGANSLFSIYSLVLNKWYNTWTPLDFARGPFMASLAELTGRFIKLFPNDPFVHSKLNGANSDRFFIINPVIGKSLIKSPKGNIEQYVNSSSFDFNFQTGIGSISRERYKLTPKECSLGEGAGFYICGWEYTKDITLSTLTLSDPFDIVFIEDASQKLVLDNAPPLTPTIKDPLGKSIYLVPAFYLATLDNQEFTKDVYTVADIAITIATVPSGIGGLVKAASWTRRALSTIEIVAATDALATGLFKETYVTQMQTLLGPTGYSAFKTLLLLDVLNGFGPKNTQHYDLDVEENINTLTNVLNDPAARTRFSAEPELITIYNSQVDFLEKFGKPVTRLANIGEDIITYVRRNPLNWPDNSYNLIADAIQNDTRFLSFVKNSADKDKTLEAIRKINNSIARNSSFTDFAKDPLVIDEIQKMMTINSNFRVKRGTDWENDLEKILKTAEKNPCSICRTPAGISLGRPSLDIHLKNVDYLLLNFVPNGKSKKFFDWVRGLNSDGDNIANSGNLSEMFQTLDEFKKLGFTENNINEIGGKFFNSTTSKMSDVRVGTKHYEFKNKEFPDADNFGSLQASDIEQVVGSESAFAKIGQISDYEWKAFISRPGADIDNLKKLWQKVFLEQKQMIFQNMSNSLKIDLFGSVPSNIQLMNFDVMTQNLNSKLYNFIK